MGRRNRDAPPTNRSHTTNGSDRVKALTDKAKIRILQQVNKRLAHDMQEIVDISRKSLEWSEANGYKRGKRMEQVSDIAAGALLYLDCRAADLMELSRDVPKSQMILRGTER